MKGRRTSLRAITTEEYEDEQSDSSDHEETKKQQQVDAVMLRAARRLQRAFRTRRFVVAVEKAMMLNKMRKHVLKEIVSSEAVYESRLDSLVTQFVRPLQAFFTADVSEMCFPGILLIRELHREAPLRLESLGSDLLALASRIEPAYGPHVVHLARGSKTLHAQLAALPKARAAVEAAVSENLCLRGTGYLDSLLIQPTQRLARFPLLLREALKYTSDAHRDHAQLTAALALFSQTASHIDAAKKNEDQLRRKLFLQSHASTVTRSVHELALQASSSVHMCGVCERAIWGVSRKHFKCDKCRCKVRTWLFALWLSRLCQIHLECKVPALCGSHCVHQDKLDLSQDTILSEYFVDTASAGRGYVLLTTRGVAWGAARSGSGGSGGGGEREAEEEVQVAQRVKWKELRVEAAAESDGPKHFAVALSARQVVSQCQAVVSVVSYVFVDSPSSSSSLGQ